MLKGGVSSSFHILPPVEDMYTSPTRIHLVVIPDFRLPNRITTLHTMMGEMQYALLRPIYTEIQATECSA